MKTLFCHLPAFYCTQTTENKYWMADAGWGELVVILDQEKWDSANKLFFYLTVLFGLESANESIFDGRHD